MRGGGGQHVVVWHDGTSGEALVDGEQDARHRALAVVRREFVQRERDAGLAEVAARGAGHRLAGVRCMSVDVDVDRRQGVDGEGGGAHGAHDPPAGAKGCLTERFA